MTKPRIIGITGRMDAGKSTAADYLRKHHGYAGSNLTDPMDEMLAPLMRRMNVPEHEIMPRLMGPMKNDPITGYEWLSGRKLKQALGLEFRDAVSRPTGDGETDRALFQKLWIDDNAEHPFLVHEQVRYAHEAAYLKSLGAIIIEIVDPDAVRTDMHASEDIGFPVDVTIDNPKTGLDALHVALDKLVDENPSDQVTRSDHPLAGFEADIDTAMNEHGPAIRAYADRVDVGDEHLSEVLDDIANEIKGHLGADAANTAADDQADAAISAVEAWVTDNVSNSTSDRRVAAVYAQMGPDEAVRRLDGKE